MDIRQVHGRARATSLALVSRVCPFGVRERASPDVQCHAPELDGAPADIHQALIRAEFKATGRCSGRGIGGGRRRRHRCACTGERRASAHRRRPCSSPSRRVARLLILFVGCLLYRYPISCPCIITRVFLPHDCTSALTYPILYIFGSFADCPAAVATGFKSSAGLSMMLSGTTANKLITLQAPVRIYHCGLSWMVAQT